MKKKEIRKALEGGTPFSSLYSLLPSGQKEKFKQFAAAFGFTERQVRERLRTETRELLIDNGRPASYCMPQGARSVFIRYLIFPQTPQ